MSASSHLRDHLTDGRWHDDCRYCLRRRSEGGSGVEQLTVKPEQVQVDDEIRTDLCGVLTVIATPVVDLDPEGAGLDRVYVDVSSTAGWSVAFDPDNLPAATGAEAFQWLGMTPVLRYRLVFLLTAELQVQR